MFIWTFIISLMALIGDVLLKKAAIGHSNNLLVSGIGCYIINAVLWYVLYKNIKFSTVAIIYSVFTILLSIIIGILYFNEHLGIKEIIGIILGVISLILLSGLM